MRCGDVNLMTWFLSLARAAVTVVHVAIFAECPTASCRRHAQDLKHREERCRQARPNAEIIGLTLRCPASSPARHASPPLRSSVPKGIRVVCRRD